MVFGSLLVMNGLCRAGAYKFEKLGAPLTTGPARAAFVVKDPQGRSVLWGIIESATKKGVFAAYLDDGKTLWLDLAPYRPSHIVMHATPDERIYVYAGTPGHFFKFNWEQGKLVDLGVPTKQSSYLLGYAVGPDGKIYVGVNPQARLVCVDPKTDKVADLGRMSEDPAECYLLHPAVSDENVAYCPVGLHHPELWALDLTTGRKKQLLTPELQAHMAAKKVAIPYVWLDKTGEVFADLGGKIGLCRADHIEFPKNPPPRSSSVLNYRPSKTQPLSAGNGEIVGFNIAQGRVEIKNTKTRKTRVVQTQVPGVGVGIYSIGCELNGKLYGGGVKPANTFEMDLATGQMRDLGMLGKGATQVYDVIACNGGLYQSSYAEGSLTYFDPTRPKVKDVNPKEIATLSKTHDQERAPQFARGPDGMLYVGTIPVKGHLGGALVRINPADNAVKVWRNIVPNQSLLWVEPVPETGEMFVSTGVGGGSSAIPTEKEAFVFLWDCKTERISWQGSPIPGTTAYGRVIRAGNGLIYGLVNSSTKLYAFDPAKRKTLKTVDLPVKNIWWRGFADRPGPDGRIIGLFEGGVFAVDPKDNSVKVIAEDSSLNITFGDIYLTEKGVLYYSHHDELWRVNLYHDNE